jgi:cobalt-zinc-cadmium efflux system membrane fusion protein
MTIVNRKSFSSCSLAAIFAGLAGMILLLSGCNVAREEQATTVAAATTAPQNPDEVTLPVGSPKLARIHVEKISSGQVPMDEVTAPGRVLVNPNRVSHIVLPVAGRIATVSARIGDLVQQGQVLVTVEGPDVDAAVSAYQQALAQLTQAKSAMAKAQADRDRSADLFEHQAIAKKELLNDEATLTQAQATVEQAEAGIQQGKRRLEILGLQPGQYGQKVAVRAPISGKVMELTVVPGEYRNDTNASLMTVADLSTVWVTAAVPETSIRLIDVGERVKVEFNAYPGEMFLARVMQIADVVDPATRTIEVRAELENPKGRFRPEMYGQIRHTEGVTVKPVVPAAAVVQEDGRNIVWLQTSPGVFRRTPVDIGPRVGNLQAIDKGVQAGDQLVTDGVMLLKAN